MKNEKTETGHEQKVPKDVNRSPGMPSHADEASVATPFIKPDHSKDENDRPVVNPVTGGAL